MDGATPELSLRWLFRLKRGRQASAPAANRADEAMQIWRQTKASLSDDGSATLRPRRGARK